VCKNEFYCLCVAAKGRVPFTMLRTLLHHCYIEQDGVSGNLTQIPAYEPAPTEPHVPDLFWYGIHSVETVYTLDRVERTCTEGADVVRASAPDPAPPASLRLAPKNRWRS
jgi:hypothetical protein